MNKSNGQLIILETGKHKCSDICPIITYKQAKRRNRFKEFLPLKQSKYLIINNLKNTICHLNSYIDFRSIKK